jgi:hypothetical protein
MFLITVSREELGKKKFFLSMEDPGRMFFFLREDVKKERFFLSIEHA